MIAIDMEFWLDIGNNNENQSQKELTVDSHLTKNILRDRGCSQRHSRKRELDLVHSCVKWFSCWFSENPLISFAKQQRFKVVSMR